MKGLCLIILTALSTLAVCRPEVTLSLNRFAEMADSDYRTLLGYRMARNVSDRVVVTSVPGVRRRIRPGGVNWTALGVVTPVKDQGLCGSCWAFAATGALESLNALRTRNLVPLSERNVLNCVRDPPTQGCGGGSACIVFDAVTRNRRGLCPEKAYPPYKAVRSAGCERCDPRAKTSPPIAGMGWVPYMNESALLEAVTRQPIAVAVDASSLAFRLYRSGVLGPRDCGTQPNHAVLLTGYGRSGKTNYWIIKNSWGTGWGENGYARLRRNVPNRPKGTCGILLNACFPY